MSEMTPRNAAKRSDVYHERAELSRDEARSLTDEVKGDAERLWRKLVELYEGDAHKALGYTSWGGYFKAEFGGSHARAYQLLDAGRVATALESSVQHVGLTPNARQAAELAPLKNDPEVLRETWAEVVELNPDPTAADVREVVQQKIGPMGRKAKMNADAEARRVYTALSGIEGYAKGLAGVRIDRVLAVASTDDLAAWEGLAGEAISELNRLRRALRRVA